MDKVLHNNWSIYIRKSINDQKVKENDNKNSNINNKKIEYRS